ncbi:hypothetical protein BDW22DRAFT_1487229 [Trametopsis cervina]|nr:hypothetical protein BDW22DRAFT_1487229 [Trametopsis cervina]
MLSTLSSFLPPSMQLGAQDKAGRPSGENVTPGVRVASPTEIDSKEGEGAQSQGGDEPPLPKKKERTHESFIVVRPPPSKSNHPLNLQVQLVPPSSRAPLPRASVSVTSASEPGQDSSATGSPLARTSSNRSDVSNYSAMTSFSTASTSSFSSVASTSTSSTSGGRRMIIPLYNLQAHNVMTNVIVDAGTDAKIAKFHKRGLEIIGLAMLDVVETTRSNIWPFDDRHGHAQQGSLLATEGHTPTSSHVSLNSENTHESPPMSLQQHQASPLTPSQPEKSGARRLFGKVFKKKGDGSPAPPTPTSPYLNISSPRSPLPPMDRDASVSTTPKASNKRSSLLLSASAHSPSPSSSDPLASPAVAQQQTVLGISPIIQTAINGSDGRRERPTRYVWIVRKWLKGPPSGVTLPGGTPLDGLVEVSFEWVRSASKRKDSRRAHSKSMEKRNSRLSSNGAPSNTPSIASLKRGQGRSSESRGRSSMDGDQEFGRQQRTRSPESLHSAHTHTTATTEDGSPSRPEEEEDSDSDPEDSETPWTCQLVVRKLQASQSRRLSHVSTDDGHAPSPLPTGSASVKVKVAAVVPAPHHPKVVSLLKIPFPLPDIILTSKVSQAPPVAQHSSLYPHIRHGHSRDIEVDVEARKRIVTPQGVARPAIAGSPPATPTQAAINTAGSPSLQKLAGKFMSSMSGPQGANGLNAGPGSDLSLANPHGNTGGEGILLSAEEIKDLVCCTGLWVVVREAFGGVGRVSRKGDGWRIRG